MASKEEREERKKRAKFEYKKYIKENKVVFAVYTLLRAIVIAVMILQFINGNYGNVFTCILVLVLFMVPSFFERRLKIDVPNVLEVIILFFIFAAEIVGEIAEFYVYVPIWDTLLHTLNGFIMAAVGLGLIDILNRSDRVAINLSPLFVALVAFCFSMTIGVLWEFFEYFVDMFTQSDMQKDTIVNFISSVSLHPDGRNIAIAVSDISKTVIYGTVDGSATEIVIEGYLDIGLYDTMQDLLVNFIGAAIFSVIGFFYVKNRGENRIIRNFMLTRMSSDDKDPNETYLYPLEDEEAPEDAAPGSDDDDDSKARYTIEPRDEPPDDGDDT